MTGKKELSEFILKEKIYFKSLNLDIDWNSDCWDCSTWLPHRGEIKKFSFNAFRRNEKMSEELSSFNKAFLVYLQRTRNLGFMSIFKYQIECRRLFSILNRKGKTCITTVTRIDFEECIDLLIESNYKNIYDAAAALKVIADTIDLKKIAFNRIDFHHLQRVSSSRHVYTPLAELGTDAVRKQDQKLPSLEALVAYAKCSNNPIDENEEILIRAIDLLFATGQRANEITFLPYDCWVEFDVAENKKYGIRYYPEKSGEIAIHWLADQDVIFAKRAIDRLKILTEEARAVARWQEENPNRVWSISKDEILRDELILKYLQFQNVKKLNRYLKETLNVTAHSKHKNQQCYRAGDIEDYFLANFTDHVPLKLKIEGGIHTVLKTSEMLCIFFKGSLSFKRQFKNKLFPIHLTLHDINRALGRTVSESIFSRRSMREPDGKVITFSSHIPRHWRNTIYELAGMSNTQQALALGRRDLSQNETYQHTSIIERTSTHRGFLNSTGMSKINLLRDAIRNKEIAGAFTDTYHRIITESGLESAESFLLTHANAIHLTPFGGCTHDFSQAPCPKYLQCWNGCSHLHLTGSEDEIERLQRQIDLTKMALNKMLGEIENEYGVNVWINDLQKKIANMELVLRTITENTSGHIFKDFSDPKQFSKKTSSVSDE